MCVCVCVCVCVHACITSPSEDEHFKLFREPNDKGAQLWKGSKYIDHWEAQDDDCRNRDDRYIYTQVIRTVRMHVRMYVCSYTVLQSQTTDTLRAYENHAQLCRTEDQAGLRCHILTVTHYV